MRGGHDMKIINRTEFIFSTQYRLQRHLLYWALHIVLWSCFWSIWEYWVTGEVGIVHHLLRMLLSIPAFIAFSIPIIYWMMPRLLMKGLYVQFILAVAAWGLAGIYLSALYRQYFFIPFQDYLGFYEKYRDVKSIAYYLCMATTAAEASILSLFKHWTVKQQEWREAEQEKITAQLQLLKAQLHPHFLFNTLNNIYGFALERSHKTPQLILKLSSLLSYMLYECKANEVLLKKEVEIMKDYIDLERERYGDKIDISVNIEGSIQDRFIAPLLILPFLENAFKHGTSEQIEHPWMSIDLAVKDGVLKCKVVNSKNEVVPFHENGVGITNIKKRLELLYPAKHELKLADEGAFFVVSLVLELKSPVAIVKEIKRIQQSAENTKHEIALPAY